MLPSWRAIFQGRKGAECVGNKYAVAFIITDTYDRIISNS